MKDAVFHLALFTYDVVAKCVYADGIGCTLGQSSMPAITKIHADRPPAARSYIAEAIEGFVMVLLECRDEVKNKIHRSRNRTFKWTFRGHAILSTDMYTD